MTLEAPGRAWIARVYGEPAAYLLAVYVFSLEYQGLTAEIDEFYVVPAQGQDPAVWLLGSSGYSAQLSGVSLRSTAS